MGRLGGFLYIYEKLGRYGSEIKYSKFNNFLFRSNFFNLLCKDIKLTYNVRNAVTIGLFMKICLIRLIDKINKQDSAECSVWNSFFLITLARIREISAV